MVTRLNRIALLIFFLCIATELLASNADGIEGKWYGTAGFPQDRIDVGFEFKKNAAQEMKVYLYEPVVNFYGLELPGILKKDGTGYVLEDYRLRLTLEDDKLEGTYLPLNAPISLTRTENLPEEVAIPDFPSGPDPKWHLKLGSAIYAPAAIHDNFGYVGTSGGMFYAINLADGSFAWAFPAGRGIFGGALITEDAAYFVCDNGYLFKLDRLKGTEIWRYDLGDERASRILEHQVIDHSGDFDFDHLAPRPLLIDGNLYVGSGDGTFHAIDASSGKNVWKFQGKGKARTNAATDGSRIFFGTFENMVYALDRATGKELWNRDTHAEVTSSPVLIGDKLIVGNRGGLLAALNPADGKTIWRMVFWGSSVESTPTPGEGSLFYIGSSDMRRLSLIDSADGRVLWRTDVFGWAWPQPLVTKDHLYMSVIGAVPYQMRHLGSLTALDRATGKILWRRPMPEWPGAWTNGFVAPPVLQNSLLIVGGLDGTLYAFPVS
jgi:outer membrane protein assembly factor BamB